MPSFGRSISKSLKADGLLGFFSKDIFGTIQSIMSEFIRNSYSREVKRELRALAEEAYETELRLALSGLESNFQKWRVNNIATDDLVQAIHVFHDKTSRELYKKYRMGMIDLAVVDAISTNILAKDRIPDFVMQALEPLI